MEFGKNKKITIPKILVILGPTASGKSDLAVTLAREFSGEIVSADSRQVYKGLDIGTGKITEREMRGIPHHLLDVASPRRVFTAADFAEQARAAISAIAARGKLPIVCGGTGFYIEVLLGAIALSDVPPNATLRKELEKETTEALVRKLQKLNHTRAETIDTKNRHRLIRAIEVACGKLLAEGYTLPPWCPQGVALRRVFHKQEEPQSYCVLKIGIAVSREKLKEKIAARLRARLAVGMVEEVARLHTKGLSWKRMEELGLEYRFLARYLRKKISKEEMTAQLETAINQYAKRQTTWFKRDKEIYWVSSDEYKKTKKMVAGFLA